jgi:hypothetical protein
LNTQPSIYPGCSLLGQWRANPGGARARRPRSAASSCLAVRVWLHLHHEQLPKKGQFLHLVERDVVLVIAPAQHCVNVTCVNLWRRRSIVALRRARRHCFRPFVLWPHARLALAERPRVPALAGVILVPRVTRRLRFVRHLGWSRWSCGAVTRLAGTRDLGTQEACGKLASLLLKPPRSQFFGPPEALLGV